MPRRSLLGTVHIKESECAQNLGAPVHVQDYRWLRWAKSGSVEKKPLTDIDRSGLRDGAPECTAQSSRSALGARIECPVIDL
jgi:hypothetical protein